MESLEDIAKRQQAGRPNYYDDPQKDHMLALILELTEEICVLEDRLASCTELDAKGEPCNADAIQAFEPSTEEMNRRLAKHMQTFEQIFLRLHPSRAVSPISDKD